MTSHMLNGGSKNLDAKLHFEGKINQLALNAQISFIYQNSSKILNIVLNGKNRGRKFRFSRTLKFR